MASRLACCSQRGWQKWTWRKRTTSSRQMLRMGTPSIVLCRQGLLNKTLIALARKPSAKVRAGSVGRGGRYVGFLAQHPGRAVFVTYHCTTRTGGVPVDTCGVGSSCSQRGTHGGFRWMEGRADATRCQRILSHCTHGTNAGSDSIRGRASGMTQTIAPPTGTQLSVLLHVPRGWQAASITI